MIVSDLFAYGGPQLLQQTGDRPSNVTLRRRPSCPAAINCLVESGNRTGIAETAHSLCRGNLKTRMLTRVNGESRFETVVG
jgi:hypothetical protein